MTFTKGDQFTIRPILIGFTIIEFITLLLAFLGILEPAKIIISAAAFAAITLFISIGGIHDDSIGGFYILLILTTLFFGRKGLSDIWYVKYPRDRWYRTRRDKRKNHDPLWTFD